ncbi:F0F1 ATP synthase subunit delta [Georgenia sunbinii]|uniref:F0F1 ATP synthase subunit delta n=1 Tax=Georgenia sunbinii TaxID=3117728 RepID=UPI002F2613A9
MRASSQAALTAASERFEPVLRDAGARAEEFGTQLYGLADTLRGSGSLRRALSDPSRDGEAKARLIGSLLEGKVAAEVLDLVSGMVRSRWSQESDLATAVEELGTTSILAAAQSQGTLLQVEEELFRTERLLASSRDLRAALADTEASAERRIALIGSLIGSRALPATQLLVNRQVSSPHRGTLGSALRSIGEIAARRREQRVATVTAASPLSQAQEARLAQILGRSYGGEVHVNVAIDPRVVGGLRVQIGDEIIDATMLSRLQDARRRFSG